MMIGNIYKVLVTSADTNAALAVTKSLGKKGIEVTCADCKDAKSFYSRYCKNKLVYPSPEKQPYAFINFLLSEVKKHNYDVLFPITDTDTYLISKYLNEFSPYVKVAINNHLTSMKVLDKCQTIKIASKINVPVPKTIFINDLNELNEISKILEFPLIIKPRQSSTFVKNKVKRGSTSYVISKEEFFLKYEELHKKSSYPLVQEYISGKEKGVFMLLHKGELKAVFSHQRIRSLNPLGGASALCKSIDLNPKMKDYALKMLREINWEGVAMVEFKIDSRDNIPKLMEINGRFWGSLQLAISSGVDFPYLLFKTVIAEDVEPVLDYRKGIKYRYLLGDFIHLFYVMKGNRNYGFEYPKRLPTLRNFMKFYEKNLVYDDISFSDPMINIKTFIDIFIGLPKTLFLKKVVK